MGSVIPNGVDLIEIYRQYCDIVSRSYACGNESCSPDKESQKGRFTRESLNQLFKWVESRSWTRIAVCEEIYKLMLRLDLMTDPSEFSRFYDFVFFICRENGQKNITVSRAIMAWRLVLAGRFQLLNEWCDYVEQNQRHNISEDTWRQLLAFSRCVKDNLEGYDAEGAWPILIDDFVEHLYRSRSQTIILNSCCKCGDLVAQQLEVSLPDAGFSDLPALKRKFYDDIEKQNGSLDDPATDHITSKRRQIHSTDVYKSSEEYTCDRTADDSMEISKQNSPRSCSKCPCAIEGCLSKGFAGLFSGRPCVQLNGRRKVS